MCCSLQPEKPASPIIGEEILLIYYANKLPEPPLGGGLSIPREFSRNTEGNVESGVIGKVGRYPLPFIKTN